MSLEVTSEIILDVAGKSNRYTTIRAKQGDSLSRFVHATIMNGGTKYVVPSNSTVLVNFMRYDEEKKSYQGEVITDLENEQNNGTIKFPLPAWALELAHTVTCDVSIIANESHRLTTFNFCIDVEAASYSDQSILSEDDQLPYLLQLIQQNRELAEDFTGYYVNDTSTKIVDVTLANRTHYCYKAGISSCVIRIPSTAQQGWVADFAFKIGNAPAPFTFINNNNSLILKLVQYSSELNNFAANANGIVHIFVAVDGITVQCIIEELAG